MATILLIAVAAQVLWSSFERSKDANRSVEHAYTVLIKSGAFAATIREAESALRAYIISRQRQYLQPYDADKASLLSLLSELQNLTRDNSEQQEHLKAIRNLSDQRLASLDAAVQATDQHREDLIAEMVRSGRGAEIMQDLTSRLKEFEEKEHQILALQTAAADNATNRARFLLVFTSIALALFFLFAGALLERDLRNRELAHQALARQADLINFSHDAIVAVDPSGTITAWNAGAVETYGWSSAEAVGRSANEILRAEDLHLQQKIDEALSRTGRWDGVLTQTTKEGRTCVVESRYVRLLNRSGEQVGTLNVSRDETHRKLAEDSLRHVAEQRRLALDAAGLGSWDYQVEVDQVVWDDRCREIMGLPGLGPATFAQVIRRVHPNERDAMNKAAYRAMSGSEDGRFSHEMRIVLHDGSTRWIGTYGRVYFREQNGVKRPVRVIGVNSDITNRKHVEQALRDSEDRLRVALETGRIGIFVELPLEAKTVFDQRSKQLWGMPDDIVLTETTLVDFVHPDDLEKLRAARNADHSGVNLDPGEVEYRIVRPDGETRWLIARRRVYLEEQTPHPRVNRVLGVLLDVTEQKRAEVRLAEALRESDREQRRLKALLDTMPAGIILADNQNNCVDVNTEAVRIWRAGDVRTLVSHWRDFRGWHADSGRFLDIDEWPRARAARGQTVNGEIIDIQRFDGSLGTILNSASPIRDASGAIQGALSVIVDITEQRQIELALRKSEERLLAARSQLERLLEQKNVLFKEVQHRVKNNLQVVSSLLSLEAQRFQASEFHKALNESRDRVRSMALMHEKFYHLDDLAQIDFKDFVEDLARYFFGSYLADPSAISLVTNVNVRLSMDQAIPCGLILQELLSNSVKHAFPGGQGEIRIDFSGSSGNFQLNYYDNGVGLPDSVDLAAPESLGLQLVADLTSQLGGQIVYDYRGGARFQLTFH